MRRFFKIGEHEVEFKKNIIPQEVQKENWNKVEAAIQKAPVKISWLKPMLVAASFITVIVSVWLFQNYRANNSSLTEVKTAFGEIKHITLPDSTVVTLNANSVLRIPQQWQANGNRNVWLEGEAYFQVTKKKINSQPFIVHTKDVDIKVLGTKFNVNTRNEQSTVALEEGKIQLLIKGITPKAAIKKEASLVMKPGEVAVINKEDIVQLKTDTTAINLYSGWARNEFHFNNTSLTEVGKMIEDMYGYKLEVMDSSLLQKQISGELRAENITELIKVLEVILKKKITIKDKTIIIE